MRFKARAAAMPVKGATGRIYYFDPREPTTITDGRDIQFFLKHGDVVNMDSVMAVRGPEPVASIDGDLPKASVKTAADVKVEKKAKAEPPKEETPEEKPEEDTSKSDEEAEEDKPPTVISTGRKKKRGRRGSSG